MDGCEGEVEACAPIAITPLPNSCNNLFIVSLKLKSAVF